MLHAVLHQIAYLHGSVESMHWSSSQYGWTVVHFAAYNGHLEMLQELLERFNCEADKRDKKVGLLGGLVSLSQLQCHTYSNYTITIKRHKSHCQHAHIVHCSSSGPHCMLLLVLVISRLCSI